MVDEREVALHLAEACHELRTPVAVLSLVSGLLERFEALEPDRRRQVREVVARQCETLRVIIDGYLEHGRVTFGEHEDADATFRLADVAAEAVDALDPLVSRDRVTLAMDDAELRGDPRRMWSIVTNLVRNAAAYSSPESPIEVEATTSDTQVTLVVRDRGIGVPEPHLEVIFLPFQRGRDPSHQDRPAGMGLGLSIVAGHVRALGGSLNLGTREGGGTIARCTFDLA